jgi:hypothetical protein
LFLCRGFLFVGPEQETLPIPTAIPTANYRTLAIVFLDRTGRISVAWERKECSVRDGLRQAHPRGVDDSKRTWLRPVQ